MPDEMFANPRLTEIYDAFDGTRDDLDHYLSIATEMKVASVVDIGCGTGSFSCLLSREGFDVIGLEPAKASLDIARSKKYADNVHWILGDTRTLSQIKVDMAIMTGNVAQVFLEDEEWESNLKAIRNALNPNGYLVFEVRDPSKEAWLNWTREKTYKRINVPNIGIVEGWCEVTDVSDGLVSFVWTYFFKSDESTLTSKSTLRFREKKDIVNFLAKTGFSVREIRDAPDRPGQEFIFIAEVPNYRERPVIY